MQLELLKSIPTNYIGKHIYYYDEIDSTQLEAKRLARNKLPNGCIFLANNQLSGRGTKNRIWYTENGKNLTFTILLYPNCSMEHLANLTTKIAHCIIKAVYDLYGYNLEIKNPNDIMYHGKKLAGILTESATIGENISYLLIGIGLNINQEIFEEEIKNIATSLKKEFHIEFSKEQILMEFCKIFEEEYEKIIK